MKTVLKLSVIVCATLLFFSCSKEHSNPVDTNPPAAVYDTASKAFFTSSGITDTVQMRAIDNLVLQLKKDGLWDKFLAIYPMVGGNASTTKWNLKDPRDDDAAYRLTFYGNPVFDSTGVLFPTTADYADSHLVDSAIGGYNNSAISYYSRTQNEISGYDMGCTDGAYPYNELSVYSNAADTSGGADNTEWFGYSPNLNTPNTTGLFMVSSTDTDVKRYRNGVVVGAYGHPPRNSYTNLTIWIGTTRVTVRPGRKECALATIGKGLTDAEALTFYNDVEAFEDKLGR